MIHDWDKAAGAPSGQTRGGGGEWDSTQLSHGNERHDHPSACGKDSLRGAGDGGFRGWSVSDLHFRTRQEKSYARDESA